MKKHLIPRALIPEDLRAPAADPSAPPRRLTTLLDDRTVIAANLPRNGLEIQSHIPAHLPLGVLAERVVVPRDTPATPFDAAALHPDYDTVTVMDQRVSIPAALPVVELQRKAPVSAYQLPDVLQPDVINTGEVNFSVEPIEQPSRDWDWIARMGSTAAHILVVLFVIFMPKLFPYRAPTATEIDNARNQLSFIYMPPDVRGIPRPAPVPVPQLRVDPGVLRRAAPPSAVAPMPAPLPAPRAPDRAVREAPAEPPPPLPELPPAPRPSVEASNRPPDFLRGPSAATPPPQTQPQLQARAQPQPPSGSLQLPRNSSPGRALQDTTDQALRGAGGGTSVQFGGPLGQGGYGGGSGGGGGFGGGALQMLTPTEGVDFSNYLARVLASVKRNWYSIMPESAKLGDRGNVTLQFRIMQNGQVPGAEPSLMGSSGKEPLDRAAMSAIRASSPFEPLPPAFHGPFIELRFIFLYNPPPGSY